MKEFKERQQFRNPVLLGALALGTFYYFGQLLDTLYKSNFAKPDTGLIMGSSAMALVLALFIFAQLNTVISEKGIMIRFFPFHTRYVLYPRENIEKVELVKYSPLKDFGGWGIRYGWQGTKAFNVKGENGILLELKNGDKRLIGTQKPEEVRKSLSDLGFTTKGSLTGS